MNAIKCSHNGCLASVYWYGRNVDELLADFAKERGWAVHEGTGWLCPRHAPAAIRSRLGEVGDGRA